MTGHMSYASFYMKCPELANPLVAKEWGMGNGNDYLKSTVFTWGGEKVLKQERGLE